MSLLRATFNGANSLEQLIIEGGHSLKGAVRISGAKNASLPVLAASLLTSGISSIEDVPELKDIATFLNLLKVLGVEVNGADSGPVGGSIQLDTRRVTGFEAPYELVRTMRASVLVLGPLVARQGRCRLSMPGGCAIGARPIDFHLKGLEKMGARLSLKEGYVEVTASRLKGAEICFDIPSVTGTENLMMAASLAKGRTILKNTAREPEVTDLARMLIVMGARIQGAGTSTIVIEGVSELTPINWRIISDRIEAGTYVMAAAVAGGELTLHNVNPLHLGAAIGKLREAGVEIEEGNDILHVKRRGSLKSVDVTTMPYPGFPTDLQAQFMTVMTMADGLSVIKETIFENRFMHVAELRRMGADIRIEGNSSIVKGVRRLTGAPVMATDLRASASLVLAGLAAKGKTIISRVYHLDRGYEAMEKKLSQIGARIDRVKSDTPY